MNKLVILTLLLFVPMYAQTVFAASDWKPLLSVPKAQYLFGISVSPDGSALLLYRSFLKPEGESNSGVAIFIKLKNPPEITPITVSSTLEDVTLPVWSKDGHKAYFLTETGIYCYDDEIGISKVIVHGTLAGLAISPDDTKLAFWNLGLADGSYVLSIFSLHANRVIKNWRVPTLYDSDQYGHEIAFSNDGASLFARTYDVEDRTPLKQFVISSGIIRTIWQDCIGLAKGRSSVYFVGNRNGKTALYEIDKSMATPRILPDIFPFDSLLSSGTRRMIISTNSRRNNIAVFDSMSHKLTTIDSRCENAAAYDNHKIFCSREGNLYLVNSR